MTGKRIQAKNIIKPKAKTEIWNSMPANIKAKRQIIPKNLEIKFEENIKKKRAISNPLP